MFFCRILVISNNNDLIKYLFIIEIVSLTSTSRCDPLQLCWFDTGQINCCSRQLYISPIEVQFPSPLLSCDRLLLFLIAACIKMRCDPATTYCRVTSVLTLCSSVTAIKTCELRSALVYRSLPMSCGS